MFLLLLPSTLPRAPFSPSFSLMGVPCGNLILVLVASTHLHAESLPITATSSLPAHLQHLSERPFYIPTTTFISEAEAEQSTQHGRWFSKILSTIKNAVVGTFSSSGKTTKTRAYVDGGIDSPSGDGGDDPWVPQLGDKGGWFTTTDKGKKVRVSIVARLRQFIPVSVSISLHECTTEPHPTIPLPRPRFTFVARASPGKR